jgi:ATP synthase protein I
MRRSATVVAAGRPPHYNSAPSREPIVDSSSDTVDFASVRRQALWVVAGQVAVAVCGALLCYVWLNAHAAISALVGGGIGAAATLTQVVVGLRNTAGRAPREVMRGFYRGSAMKFAVTVVLFVLALRGRRFAAGPLFGTYVVTFVVYWLALARGLHGEQLDTKEL